MNHPLDGSPREELPYKIAIYHYRDTPGENEFMIIEWYAKEGHAFYMSFEKKRDYLARIEDAYGYHYGDVERHATIYVRDNP